MAGHEEVQPSVLLVAGPTAERALDSQVPPKLATMGDSKTAAIPVWPIGELQ